VEPVGGKEGIVLIVSFEPGKGEGVTVLRRGNPIARKSKISLKEIERGGHRTMGADFLEYREKKGGLGSRSKNQR